MTASMKTAANILRISFALMTIGFIFYDGWVSYVLSGLFVLAVSCLLIIREKKYHEPFPGHLDLAANSILAMHITGYAFGFYSKFDAYDKIEHFLAGIVMSFVAYSALAAYQAVNMQKMNHFVLVVLAVAFSSLVGNLWEITEFSVDELRFANFSLATEHTQLQWGLDDTMNDVRLNLLGGSVGALMGWLIYKQKNLESVKKEMPFFVKMFS